jgi:hypothetical protein
MREVTERDLRIYRASFDLLICAPVRRDVRPHICANKKAALRQLFEFIALNWAWS